MARRMHQVAALPWRRGEHGIEILLVTTRTTKRWVIPKGWIMDGKTDHEAAAIEAYEEAGVEGQVEDNSVGSYGYLKVLRSGDARPIKVQVYALQVGEMLDTWPEQLERQRQWVTLQKAIALIDEPELLPVIAAFANRIGVAVTLPRAENKFIAMIRKWWRKLWAKN